jgi:hypothetical protein
MGGGVILPPQTVSGTTVPMKNRIDVKFFAVASGGMVAKWKKRKEKKKD